VEQAAALRQYRGADGVIAETFDKTVSTNILHDARRGGAECKTDRVAGCRSHGADAAPDLVISEIEVMIGTRSAQRGGQSATPRF